MPNRRINLPQLSDQPILVDASQFVEEYARTLALEPHFWSAAERLTGARQWCHARQIGECHEAQTFAVTAIELAG